MFWGHFRKRCFSHSEITQHCSRPRIVGWFCIALLVIVLFSFAFKGPLEGAREDIQSSVIISNCLHDIHETNIKPHIRIAASYITGQHWDGRLDEFASPIMIITSGDNYIASSNDISPSFDTW